MGAEKKTIDIWHKLALLIAVFAFFYACLRSWLIPITVDSSSTFLLTQSAPYLEIIKAVFVDNNHVLNSVMIKFFVSIFGVSEFVMRIPVLIGFIFYLAGTFMTLKLFLKKYYFTLGFAFMALHPYLIDYFSLARGYGLALGLMDMGIFFAFRMIKGKNAKKNTISMWLAFLFMALSSFANVAFFNGFIAVMLFFIFVNCLDLYKAYKDNNLKNIKKQVPQAALIISSFVLFLAAFKILIVDKLRGQGFYYGGESFLRDTVGSLAYRTAYRKSNEFLFSLSNIRFFENFGIIHLIAGLCILIGIAVAVFLVLIIFNKKKSLNKDYILFSLYLIVSWTALIIIQHLVFGVKYFAARSSIYFIPLASIFMLLLFVNLKENAKKQKLRKKVNFVFKLFLFVFIIHYLLCVNLSYFDFKPLKIGEEVIDYMGGHYGLSGETGDIMLAVVGRNIYGFYGVDPYGLKFYLAKEGLGWLKIKTFHSGSAPPDVDYHFLPSHFDYYFGMAGEPILENLSEFEVFDEEFVLARKK